MIALFRELQRLALLRVEGAGQDVSEQDTDVRQPPERQVHRREPDHLRVDVVAGESL